MIVDAKAVPGHVAIIMDGNGRWAAARSLSRSEGHKAGAEPVRAVLKAARKEGVRHLTLYTFSTENWSRSPEEVENLFGLLARVLPRRPLREFGVDETRCREMAASAVRGQQRFLGNNPLPISQEIAEDIYKKCV